jgi:hypothetical protein
MLTDRPSVPPARLEISNGNGVNDLAKSVGSYLKHSGFLPVRLTNWQSYNVAATRVEYRSGYEAQARQVATAMPHKVEVTLGTNMRLDIGVRMVLGKDMKDSLAYFEQKSAPTKLARN